MTTPTIYTHSAVILESRLQSQGFVQFHPAIADKLKHYKAAIFLGHALYWSLHVYRKLPQKNGWFFMTKNQCENATGLSRHEQDNARQFLIEHKLISTILAGQPAKTSYRVDYGALLKLLEIPDNEQVLPWLAVSQLLRSPITYYKPLSDIAGDVGSGLYLSYLISRLTSAIQYNKLSIDGSFLISPEIVRSSLCLGGPKAQRTARDRLVEKGLLTIAGKNRLILHIPVLEALMRGQGYKPLKGTSEVALPVKKAAARHLFAPGSSTSSVTLLTQSNALKTAHAKASADPSAPAQKLLFNEPLQVASAVRTVVQSVTRKVARNDWFFPLPKLEQNEVIASTNTVPCQTHVQTGEQARRFETLSGQTEVQTGKQGIQTGKQTVPNRQTDSAKPANINSFQLHPITTTYSEGVGSQSSSSLKKSTANTKPQCSVDMPDLLDSIYHQAVKQVLASETVELQQQLIDELGGRLAANLPVRSPAGLLFSLKKGLRDKTVTALPFAEKAAKQRYSTSEAKKIQDAQELARTRTEIESIALTQQKAQQEQFERDGALHKEEPTPVTSAEKGMTTAEINLARLRDLRKQYVSREFGK